MFIDIFRLENSFKFPLMNHWLNLVRSEIINEFQILSLRVCQRTSRINLFEDTVVVVHFNFECFGNVHVGNEYEIKIEYDGFQTLQFIATSMDCVKTDTVRIEGTDMKQKCYANPNE